MNKLKDIFRLNMQNFAGGYHLKKIYFHRQLDKFYAFVKSQVAKNLHFKVYFVQQINFLFDSLDGTGVLSSAL